MRSRSMPARPEVGGWLGLVLAVVIPVAVSAALVPWRTQFSNAAAALLLVCAILLAAVLGERWPGYLASVASVMAFDFFLTRPYETFDISTARDIQTTLALLVAGVAVTEIAVRSRRHYEVAMSEGNFLAAIHDLSDLVATGAPASVVIATAAEELTDLLELAECHFEPMAARSTRAQLNRNAEVELGEVRFDVGRDGFPSGEVEILVEHRGRPYGVIVMRAGSARAVPVAERVAALAIADQVGAALSGLGAAA